MFFQRIKKMSNVLIKKIEKLEVDPNKCLKVRAVTSSCSACIDACPVDAIQISLDSLELMDHCNNCGLCTVDCPTNALKWNHPPLIQLLQQALRLAKQDEFVYMVCSSSINKMKTSSLVEVPCLGMIPTEFWISLGLNAPNLEIYYDSAVCQQCENTKGEELFLKHYKAGERTVRKSFPLYSSANVGEEVLGELNHSKRRFLHTILEEMKETNTITMKEVLEVKQTLSPFEKFDQYYEVKDDSEEMVKAVNEVKYDVMDKIINDTVIYTDKRAMIYNEMKDHPQLKEEMNFSIPMIKSSCNLCAACSFLCPTDALTIEDDRLHLWTEKCVSCQLCEEICYGKHIQMGQITGSDYLAQKRMTYSPIIKENNMIK